MPELSMPTPANSPSASFAGYTLPEQNSATLAEQALHILRQEILDGSLAAGQALRLDFLKARYGISYSPLREALNRLHSEKLVVALPARGFRVAACSEEAMWDAIETRIVIDCEALRRSLAKGDAHWEAAMSAAFDALEQAHSQADGVRTEEGHQAFHNSLLAACGSPWLLDLSAMLYAQTERYRRPVLRGWDKAAHPHPRDIGLEHRQIYSAALARDAGLAAGLLARHYRETGRMVLKLMQQQAPA